MARLKVKTFKFDEALAKALTRAAKHSGERNESLIVREYVREGLRRDGFIKAKKNETASS